MPNFFKLTHELSSYASFIKMKSETGADLAIGTAFIYEYEDVYYIITNGHNVTGVNPETNMRLSSHCAFPSKIQISLHAKVLPAWQELVPEKGMVASMPRHVGFNLYLDEEHSNPDWYVHPEHGYQVDVVALPFMHKNEIPDHLLIFPINKYREFIDSFDSEARVADDVFILGYPFGITDPSEMPIWKKGSIASEPGIPYKGLPKMLVDTATRSGMSGAPVIFMRSGWHHLENGQLTDNSSIGTLHGFVGVYSGRIGAQNETEAQLGIVWRRQVIEEILAAKVRGTTDFQRI